MAETGVAQVASQIQTVWAPMFMQELRESSLLPSLVNKEYEGDIRMKGDTVKVSQINKPKGQTLTVGTDADSFDSAQLSTSSVSVKADKRFVASFEFEDLVDLQSQIGDQDSEIRRALVDSMNTEINNYLYSLVAPSASAPDHILSGVGTHDAAQLLVERKLAATAKWDKLKGWWLLLDPTYMNDLLSAQTMTSSDYVGSGDQTVIGGQIVNKRFGFNILEDNSEGILQLSPASAGAKVGLAFHPDFLLFVQQRVPTFKVSDMHALGKFGYKVSVDMVGGATLGIQGNVKHIQIYNT